METVGSKCLVHTIVEKPMTPDLSECSDAGSSRNSSSTSKFSLPHSDMRFPQKTFCIINESHEATPEVACWNEHGDAFVIKTKAAFEEKYLSIGFESFVRQLHLYGFKKVNNNKGSSSGPKKKLFIFRQEDFQRGREDLVSCMQTVKREKKNAKKVKEEQTKKILDDVIETDDESEKKIAAKRVEDVDESMHLKMDRIDSKVDGIYVKLDELSVKFQTTLSLFHTAVLSESGQYQPIPIGNGEDPNINSKRRRYSHGTTIDDSKEEMIQHHVELSEIQSELSNARQSFGNAQVRNNHMSQLTLDTDEMNVIQTLMNYDDSSCDVSENIDYENTQLSYNNTSEIKMQNQNAEMPLIENTATPVVIYQTDIETSAVEAHLVQQPLNEHLSAKKKKWYKNQKVLIMLAISILCIFLGLLIGFLVDKAKKGKHGPSSQTKSSNSNDKKFKNEEDKSGNKN